MGIGNPFKSIERSIKRGINSLGDDVKRGVNSVGNDVKNGVRSAGNSVKSEVVKAGHAIEREIEEAATTVKRHTVDEIEALAKKAKTEIEDLAEEAEDRAEEAIQMVLRELQKALTAEGLRKIRGIVHAAHRKLNSIRSSQPEYIGYVDAQGFKLKLGPATLVYENFYARAEALSSALDRFVNEPPTFRRGPIIDLINGLAPTSVDLGISVELSFVVGSNELGFGGELPAIPMALVTHIADDILEEIGVPA